MNAQISQLLIGSITGSGALWTVYRATLYNRHNHRLSRVFLNLAAFLPLCFTALQALVPVAASSLAISYALPEALVGTAAAPAEAPAAQEYGMLGIYGGFVLLLLARQLFLTLALRRRIISHPWIRIQGVTVYTGTGYGPGSLGQSVFFPDSEAPPEILKHEIGHIRLGHRFDLALINALCALAWINPFLWIIRRDLRLVHEFEADAYTAADPEPYARLLLRSGFGLPPGISAIRFFITP